MKKYIFSILGHHYGITSLVSNDEILASSDTSGKIIIWNVHTMVQTNTIEPVDNSGITSLAMWKEFIIASYANGMIRIFDAVNGEFIYEC